MVYHLTAILLFTVFVHILFFIVCIHILLFVHIQ